MNTPWGKADRVQELGRGVLFVTTPSHGGYFVPPELNGFIPLAHRLATWRGQGMDGWYEEDCDWSSLAHSAACSAVRQSTLPSKPSRIGLRQSFAGIGAMYDLSVPNAKPGRCEKCRGTGRLWGTVVNGRATKSGPCHSCRGTGRQTAGDITRNLAYNRHKIALICSTM